MCAIINRDIGCFTTGYNKWTNNKRTVLDRKLKQTHF